MVKTVGKITFYLLLAIGTSLSAQITVQLLDTDHKPLQQAGVGHPFVLEVTVSDLSLFGQMPIVEGLQEHTVKNSGMRIMSINGKTTAHYNFEIRIDKPGAYRLGPATITDRGRSFSSDTVTVIVGEQQIEKEAKKSSSKKTEASVMVRLTTNKTDLFVGEQLLCRLRFYTTDPDISLRQLIEQESPELRRSAARGPYQGSEKIDGIDYQYVEWQWYCYPKMTGAVTIPAYGADYERPVERDDFWGGFGRIFGAHRETKRIYSNGVSLNVKPVPFLKEPVTAVGAYSLFSLTATPSVAHQGEGIVVSLDLVGDGDPEAVIFAGLQGVPPELKYYESKRVVTARDDGLQHQIHTEYIVQGLKPGSWQIPAQSFYYFDTVTKKARHIFTEPLLIRILPAIPQKMAEIKPLDQDLEPLQLEGVSAVPVSYHIPWWFFILISCIPIIIVVYHGMRKLLRRSRSTMEKTKQSHYAFINGKKELGQAKSYADIYTVFIQAFADRWSLPAGAITEKFILEKLRSAGMSESDCNSWQQFFDDIIERAFSNKRVSDEKTLFSHAVVWIERLEKLL